MVIVIFRLASSISAREALDQSASSRHEKRAHTHTRILTARPRRHAATRTARASRAEPRGRAPLCTFSPVPPRLRDRLGPGSTLSTALQGAPDGRPPPVTHPRYALHTPGALAPPRGYAPVRLPPGTGPGPRCPVLRSCSSSPWDERMGWMERGAICLKKESLWAREKFGMACFRRVVKLKWYDVRWSYGCFLVPQQREGLEFRVSIGTHSEFSIFRSVIEKKTEFVGAYFSYTGRHAARTQERGRSRASSSVCRRLWRGAYVGA